ncbi:MAG: hypothetical protein JNL69_11505 [Bacteroidia bacterium]|nr:hypothetical protein [Bacteroidia bacterium]
MNDLASTITDLKTKIEKIVTLHSQLKADYDKLNVDYQNSLKQIEEQKATIESLEKSNHELLANKTEEQNKLITDTKLKIDEIMQEVDSCITLLK